MAGEQVDYRARPRILQHEAVDKGRVRGLAVHGQHIGQFPAAAVAAYAVRKAPYLYPEVPHFRRGPFASVITRHVVWLIGNGNTINRRPLVVHELGESPEVVGKEPVVRGYQVAAAVDRVVALPFFGGRPGACRHIAAVFVNYFNIFIKVHIPGLVGQVIHRLFYVDVVRPYHEPQDVVPHLFGVVHQFGAFPFQRRETVPRHVHSAVAAHILPQVGGTPIDGRIRVEYITRNLYKRVSRCGA